MIKSKKSKSKSPPKNQPSSPRNNLLTNIIAPPIKIKNNTPNIIINKPRRGKSLPPINRLSPVLQTNNQLRRGNSLPTRAPTGLASNVIGSPRLAKKKQHPNIKPVNQWSTSSSSSNRTNRTRSI